MIQRIQSLYLILTTIFSGIFLSGKIVSFTVNSENSLFINLKGLTRITEAGLAENIERIIPLSIILLVIPVLSLLIIFLYKKRKLQIRLTRGLVCLIVILIIMLVYYSGFVIRNFDAEIHPRLNLIFLLLMLISAILALRGIKKDENLIKSYDRLR